MDNTACARSRRILHAALAASALAVVSAQAQPLYAITDLGPATGKVAINDFGQATGTTALPDGTHRAFLYSGGTRIDLGVLPGASTSSGAGINRHGQVTGSVGGPGFGQQAFVYTSATGMQAIPLRALFTDAGGSGINDAGQVTGTGNILGEITSAFVYSPSTGMQDLGTLGGQFSIGLAVNNNGQVTGTAEDTILEPEAFVWSPATGMVGLNPPFSPGIPMREGTAINDAGQVAGSTGRNAFLYTPGSGVQDLGALPGDLNSRAFGINEAGNVVGNSFSDMSSREAFVYSTQAGMLSLQSLLDPASGRGWSLDTAYDINNKGQIAGIGLFKGQQHAFLLTQCRAPSGLLAKLGLR
jgi:probable HAF family extracellular repeat protein